MMWKRPDTLLALAAVAALFLAGCAGSTLEDPSDDNRTGPLVFEDGTGAIEGLVLDQESIPVPSVEVGVLGANLVTWTDEAGRFVLGNVPAGSVTLAAQRLGYESALLRFDVIAGQAISVQVELVAIVIHEPYHESIPKAGIFECTWRHPLGSGMCGFIGTTNGTTGNPLEDHVFTNSARKWNYEAHAGALTILNEMQWSQNTAGTGENLRIFFSYAERTPSHTYCQADGFSPLVLKWERDENGEPGSCLTGPSGGLSESPTIPEDGQMVQTFVSVGATGSPAGNLNAAIAFQQRFDIWFSLFYWEQAPEGFTALEDR